MRFVAALASAVIFAAPLAAQIPAAVTTDPPQDKTHPAQLVVLHIPSGGVKINGVAYTAAGAGLHPTFVLLHGLPGNEKNLDLAQAVRRAGWNAITFNFRGSWGSPGVFRFAQVLQDVDAVLAFVHDTAEIRALGIDTTRIVLAGHSMGGWAAALTAAHHPELLGVVVISAADMGRAAGAPESVVAKDMAENMESLAGVTPESMADELIVNGAHWRLQDAAPGLAHLRLLVLTANDGLAPANDSLVAHIRALGDTAVTLIHGETDHSWSDKRIALESYVIDWLARR